MYCQGLSTERLLMRPITKQDVPVWATFFIDPVATRFIPTGGETDVHKRAAFWIERQLARYAENRYGMMALINKANNELVGQCGLLTQMVDDKQELEIGYHLLPKYWKQGYAIEAAKTFRDFAFKNELSDSVISIIALENYPSQKVAVRNGMKVDKQSEFFDKDVLIYRITREEWMLL